MQKHPSLFLCLFSRFHYSSPPFLAIPSLLFLIFSTYLISFRSLISSHLISSLSSHLISSHPSHLIPLISSHLISSLSSHPSHLISFSSPPLFSSSLLPLPLVAIAPSSPAPLQLRGHIPAHIYNRPIGGPHPRYVPGQVYCWVYLAISGQPWRLR